MKNVARDFPVFRGVAVAERWAGLIDVTPDAVPVISGIDALPGLFVATGFSGHGCGIGPRSEEHTSELQSLMRISYAVFCWIKNKKTQIKKNKGSHTTKKIQQKKVKHINEGV